MGWLRRWRLRLPRARGKALDRIALSRYNMRREGWRERVWFFGDLAFRKRMMERERGIIHGIAGEYVPMGAAVRLGDDGKVYRAK